MWGKKDQSQQVEVSGSGTTTLISEGTEIRGDIRFRGVMHIEGRVLGDIWATEGTMRLVDGGVVEGDINAPHVIINGVVKGDVHATEKLELASKAVINGNVFYNLIEMAMGAQVNGSLEHTRSVEGVLEEPKAIAAPASEQDAEPVLAD